jgi:hypothetical protein
MYEGEGKPEDRSQAFHLLCKALRRASLSPFEPEPLQVPFAPEIQDRNPAEMTCESKMAKSEKFVYHWFIVDIWDLEDRQLS